MSDLRFGNGSRAAITAGLVGTLMVPLVLTAPAKAATITKSEEWNDGAPTYEFPSSITEGGVTYRLVSQSNPVLVSDVSNYPVTFRAQTRKATIYRNDGAQWNSNEYLNPPGIPETISVSQDGQNGTLRLQRPLQYGKETVVSYKTISGEAKGLTLEAARGEVPSTATAQTPYQRENLWVIPYTDRVPERYAVEVTGNYPAVTIQVSRGTRRWGRSATYQSVDDANANQQQQQQQQLQQQQAEAQRQEEERKRQEEEAKRREQEANQAKTIEEAKSQSTQLISTVEGQLNSEDSKYVSDETKQQAQTAIESLRQAMSGNDLVNINTAQGSLRLVNDRITNEISTGKSESNNSNNNDANANGTDPNLASNGTGSDDDEDADDKDGKNDESDDDEDTPKVTPGENNRKTIGMIPIAAGILGLVAAGGIITGVIIAKNKKKKEKEGQLVDENGNPIDPNAMGQPVIIGPDGQPIDPAMAAAAGAAVGVAGGAVAGGMMDGSSQVAVMPAVDELDSLALIPGYVPITDSQCQLFAYLNDDENKPIQVWNATISPADDIPTLVEVPLPEDENDAFIAGWEEEDGTYRISTDEEGNPIYQLDEDGNPILDEDGNPVPDFVIPQYFIVFSDEDVANAVSNGLLVYSDDGQEIYRGELDVYNEVDATTLWSVINEQVPEEERTDIVDEITEYVNRLDEIEDNNDAMVADYEARRQQQIADAEAAEAAAQEAQMAQAPDANDFSVVGYQSTMVGAPTESMDFTDVPGGDFQDFSHSQDFSQSDAGYEDMNMTSDGFVIDDQGQFGYDQGEATEFQTFDGEDDFQDYDADDGDFQDYDAGDGDFQDYDANDGDVTDEAYPNDGFSDSEDDVMAMPPADADEFAESGAEQQDDPDFLDETTDGFAPMGGFQGDDFGSGLQELPSDDYQQDGYQQGDYQQGDQWNQFDTSQPQDEAQPSMDYQQGYDDGFDGFDDFGDGDGFDATDGSQAQDDQPQPVPMPAAPSETSELAPEDFFGVVDDFDDFDDFEDMTDADFGDVTGAAEAVKDTVATNVEAAKDAVAENVESAKAEVGEAVDKVVKAVPRIKIPERKRSNRQ